MIIHGDCVDVMEDLIKKKVRFESIVTDPPYELGFMGKDWDKSGIANSKYMWSLAFKLLQPGGHLLAFSGTRTYHRMAVAIEDAGFEIRDMISWLYGQGFPKSRNISISIDKESGELESRNVRFNAAGIGESNGRDVYRSDHPEYKPYEPITDEAKQWQGWGTALKPACEPIVVARKPLIEGYTVSENVLTTGTGGLNIDGCRVITGDNLNGGAYATEKNKTGDIYNKLDYDCGRYQQPSGRWPANVVHDGSDEVEEAFAKFGERRSSHGGGTRANCKSMFGGLRADGGRSQQFYDAGTASRFFYCAKVSKQERAGSKHPTVKPLALMKWLVTLVTPPDGKVLDPFCGTGTTCVAAKELGFDFVGIELDEETAEFARSRLDRKGVSVDSNEDFVIEEKNDLFDQLGE